MTPERWQKVRDVLEQAMELAPEKGGLFLDVACSSDPSLRSEVQLLLSADEQARSSFLESPPLRPAALASGTKLGEYQIVSQIGSGGMGVVYRAHDTRLGREVAIKVLPVHLTSDPNRLRRFEQEAKSAAALNHPNILAVYRRPHRSVRVAGRRHRASVRSSAIHVGDARALPSRLPWSSVWSSTSASFAEFSQPITNRLQIVAVLRGSPSYAKRRTAFTASTYSDVNRWRCGGTGCWWSWTNMPAGSIRLAKRTRSSASCPAKTAVQCFPLCKFRNCCRRPSPIDVKFVSC